ncbi:acyltransferase [Agrobacterium sp. rho-13.3]|uniref:acyltransferase n=1 Tax=Agrobacterium sp. rho-13.3 TaxID=3072980 RepID=UPI002A0C022A|nr:acyltransferase [Agrobacterium sp. rho-13.3]MDX8310124.1 acyltransferase [Agrobacterium sp. rho-13.3]
MLIPYGGKITIGNDFSLNPYSVLYGQGGLVIGNDVRIAAGCVIIPYNHIFADRNKPIRLQKLSKLGIVIEDDVWIGANVTVLDGSHISKDALLRRVLSSGEKLNPTESMVECQRN